MGQEPESLVLAIDLIVESVDVLDKKFLVALKEEPDLVVLLGQEGVRLSEGLAVGILGEVKAFLLGVVFEEEADEADKLVVADPFAPQTGAILAKLLGELTVLTDNYCIAYFTSVAKRRFLLFLLQ